MLNIILLKISLESQTKLFFADLHMVVPAVCVYSVGIRSYFLRLPTCTVWTVRGNVQACGMSGFVCDPPAPSDCSRKRQTCRHGDEKTWPLL